MKLSKFHNLIGIEPGIIMLPGFVSLDFRQPVPVEVLDQLVANGNPYVELSPEGLDRSSKKPNNKNKKPQIAVVEANKSVDSSE
jgi:hypothetical protein